MGELCTWRMWSPLQCIKHNPQSNTKKSLDTVTIQRVMIISLLWQKWECYSRLFFAEKANSLIKLIFMKAGNEKSTLKVTLVPGSAYTDIPIITVQKGFCVSKSENISSPCNTMFHSREHCAVWLGFFPKLSTYIHNSIPSLWYRNTVKKMNTAI